MAISYAKEMAIINTPAHLIEYRIRFTYGAYRLICEKICLQAVVWWWWRDAKTYHGYFLPPYYCISCLLQVDFDQPYFPG